MGADRPRSGQVGASRCSLTPATRHLLVRPTATPFPALPGLQQDTRADVCVVGAGYTGLGAALELARRGVSVVVLEAAQVGSGGSGRNGGQVHVGQRNDQAWLEKTLGRDDALALWRMSQDARAHLLGLIAEHDIACDFRPA
jgi:gamma-glutamylputrescine oxidase